MAIVINRAGRLVEGYDLDGAAVSQPPFISSRNFETFKRELARYVDGEVDGRSFLIAGHRGAGKTSLVRRAIEEHRRDMIRRSVRPADAPPGPSRRPLQRPLLVKLHGPSLLAAVASAGASSAVWPQLEGLTPRVAEMTLTYRQDTDAAPKSDAPSAKERKGQGSDGGAALDDAAAAVKGSEAKASHDSAKLALTQITIALYRALAEEAAKGYGAQARRGYREEPGDRLELAGQLLLELDRAPDAAILRAFWSRLDRLKQGVFWPAHAVQQLDAAIADGQGVRELVALATAAQAFQVCSGTVKDSESEVGTASQEKTVSAGANFNLAQITNKLAALAAGGSVAAALAGAHGGDLVAALPAGLLVGLATAFTLDWSSKRQFKRQKVRDYAFILDRSAQTLDRDLPFVLERIRDAGLAPIFVVDELDKIAEAEVAIRNLINSLKHIVVDFGFFCFLADRKYYEYVHRALQNSAFPPEHTFFSDRLFILYAPEDIKAYLSEIIFSDKNSNDPERGTDDFALNALFLFILHKARLGTVDVVREVTRLSDGDGRLRAASEHVRSEPSYRLPATVQLAIEHILRGGRLKSRMESEPLFAQLAIDSLYRLSRAWGDEARTVALGRSALILHLAGRISGKAISDLNEKDALEIVRGVIGEVDIDLLVAQADRLERYLLKFDTLRDDLALTPPPEGVDILQVIPRDAPGLIELVTGESSYRFLFDAYGEDLRPSTAPNEGEAEGLRAIVRAFQGLCDAAGLTAEELVNFGLLPPTVAWSGILAAEVTVASATVAPKELSEAFKRLAEFAAVLKEETAPGHCRAERIVSVLALARMIALAAPGPLPRRLQPALAALARYVDIGSVFDGRVARPADWFALNRPSQPQLPSLAGAIGERLTDWSAWLADVQPSAVEDLQERASRAWRGWIEPLYSFSTIHEAPSWPANFDDVVLASANRLPGRLLRPQLHLLSALEWSELAFSAFPSRGGDQAPYIVLPMALAALGFGAEALKALASDPFPDALRDPVDEGRIAELSASLPEAREPDRPGVLAVYSVGPGSEPPQFEAGPILFVPQNRAAGYAEAIAWLTKRGVLKILAKEE